MKQNMGKTDKAIRMLLAAVFIVLFLTGKLTGIAAGLLLTVGAIFLLTSFMSFCPLYTLFGINTCKKQ